MDQDSKTVFLDFLGYADNAVKAEQLAHVSATEWHVIIELARQHMVTPMLYYRLRPLGSVISGELMEGLRKEYWKNELKNIRLYQELNKLLRLLQEKDIAVIALKGSYLAEAVYDDLGLRTMEDVDLLVKKDDLSRLDRDLLTLGCSPEDHNREVTRDTYHFGYRMPKSGLRVEFHWAWDTYRFQPDMADVWNRAQPLVLAQAHALALSPVDLLLHLCLHMTKHAYDMHIRMLIDIGEVVRHFKAELDWQEIGTRARQWGIQRAVYVILRLAQELLDVPVPAEWLVSFRPSDFNDRYLGLMQEQIFADPRTKGEMGSHHEVARMWARKGLGGKLALACERLWLPREVMALKYPAPANSWRIYLYYPVRLKAVLQSHGGELWRIIRSNSEARAAAKRSNEVSELHDWLMMR
ncbi:MAG: nucleotidyltransferase family protein [Anaerolineales bacterium]